MEAKQTGLLSYHSHELFMYKHKLVVRLGQQSARMTKRNKVYSNSLTEKKLRAI
jgi:hypothetical protein